MAGYSKDIDYGVFLRKLLTTETSPTNNTINSKNLFYPLIECYYNIYNRAYIWTSANQYKYHF